MKTKTIAIAAVLLLPALQSCSILHGPPEPPDAQKPARSVTIGLHASPNLNAGADKQPFALAVRIYKLRQQAAFQRMPFDGFLSLHSERELLGNDLLEVKEVMLIPNQRYQVVEKVTREAYYIGVVALFRAPAADRWRMIVPASDAEKSGITIGLHACAISTGDSLVPVRCD
jgi:type VI secretion system protein VasD